MSENNSLTVIDKKTVTNAQQILKGVTEQHTKVSQIETPKAYVYKKQGFDYVKLEYMRAIADKNFPGWSWTIISTEVLGSEAYVVHGRLKWFDNGIWRKGDMVAAHRIQTKRGGDANDFVDIGNDIKSANTDCMKKALNVYLDIAADVYRSEDYELADKEREDLLKWASKAGMYQEILDNIEEGSLNANNFEGSLAKLRRLAE